jgi:hypothetical protein
MVSGFVRTQTLPVALRCCVAAVGERPDFFVCPRLLKQSRKPLSGLLVHVFR